MRAWQRLRRHAAGARLPCSAALLLGIASLAAPTAFAEPAAPAEPGDASLLERARERAGSLETPIAAALERFYADRAGRPAWRREASFGRGAGPRPEAQALIAALRDADRSGLDPAHYRPDALARQLEETDWGSAGESAAADLALSESFLVFARDLARGRVDPARLEITWHADIAEPELAQWLEAVFARGLDEVLAGAQPPHAEYRALREALARYRGIEARGGWAPLEDARDARALRARLEAEGYDVRSLEPAIRAFQMRHGLADDGVAGPDTLEALNVPAGARAEQIALNLERWRWLPRDLGDPQVRVNIPSFELEVREGGRRALAMPVVVGKVGRSTPVMSDRIEAVVLNPYWNVPRRIAVEEIVPKLEHDPGHLAAMEFEVVSGWQDPKPVDPDTVDWEELAEEDGALRLRQRPGPVNALGRVKFLLPNRLDIYLHDTPSQEIFEETDRDFSHGCIRLARPIDLARYLLRADPEWDDTAIRSAIARGEQLEIPLAEPVSVHLLYATALPHPDGGIAFYRDVYGMDERLRRALDAQRVP